MTLTPFPLSLALSVPMATQGNQVGHNVVIIIRTDLYNGTLAALTELLSI